MPNIGDQAPAFELPDSDMHTIRSANLVGKPYVLYFYPKDDTPGCTIEALEFTDLACDFEAIGCSVFGISKDTCVSHAAFRDKHGLTVQLLADVEGNLCQAYDVWREKEKNGEKKMGIVRSTFIIDGDGVLRYMEDNVKPKGHAEAILEKVKAL